MKRKLKWLTVAAVLVPVVTQALAVAGVIPPVAHRLAEALVGALSAPVPPQL